MENVVFLGRNSNLSHLRMNLCELESQTAGSNQIMHDSLQLHVEISTVQESREYPF